jgi:hypothetical protein
MRLRQRAGIFDVSHMGEIEIAGRNALDAVQRISSNDASKLQPGQAQYSGLLTASGTFVDDLLVYRSRAVPFSARRERLAYRRGLRAHRREHQDRRRCRGGRRQLPLRAPRRSGPESVGSPAAADRRRSGGDEVLLVRTWRGRRSPRNDLANGLHRRRWGSKS